MCALSMSICTCVCIVSMGMCLWVREHVFCPQHMPICACVLCSWVHVYMACICMCALCVYMCICLTGFLQPCTPQPSTSFLDLGWV